MNRSYSKFSIILFTTLYFLCACISLLFFALGNRNPVYAQEPGIPITETATDTNLGEMAAPLNAPAENPIALTLSPPLAVLQATESGTLRQLYVLHNEGKTDLAITLTMKRFHADDVSGNPVLDMESTTPFASIETAGFAMNQAFVLKAGQVQQIVILFNLPSVVKQDIPLTLLANAKAAQETQLGVSTAQVSMMIGGNIIIRTNTGSTISQPIVLEDFQVPRIADVFMDIPLHVLAKNIDSTANIVRGTLSLVNSSGKIIEMYGIVPDLILAQSSRVVRIKETGVATPSAKPIVAFSSKHLPGKYDVVARVFSDKGDARTYTQTIYLLPISAIGILCLILVVLSAINFFLRKQ